MRTSTKLAAVAALSAFAVAGTPAAHAGNPDILIVTPTDGPDTGKMYTMRPDGTGKKLLHAGRTVLSAEVSPDGTQVAFGKEVDGNWDIYVMPLAGGPARRLTTSEASDQFPTWSPDGKTIAYGSGWAWPDARTSDIWTVNATGKPVPKQLTNIEPTMPSAGCDNGRYLSEPDYSDGRMIVTDWCDMLPPGNAKFRTLFVDPSTGAPGPMIPNIWSASFSPDGDQLLAVANPRHDITKPTVIVRYSTGGKRIDTVTDAHPYTAKSAPVWSPDGMRAAFSTLPYRLHSHTVNVDGTDREHLAKDIRVLDWAQAS